MIAGELRVDDRAAPGVDERRDLTAVRADRDDEGRARIEHHRARGERIRDLGRTVHVDPVRLGRSPGDHNGPKRHGHDCGG